MFVHETLEGKTLFMIYLEKPFVWVRTHQFETKFMQ